MTPVTSTRLRRAAIIPDIVRVARYHRAPEIGPRLLFFSGGTALREVSQILTDYTHNSFHLITPFDSGGSSATLRRAFGMISVGDLRNRLLALADRKLRGHPEIYRLFAYRFTSTAFPSGAPMSTIVPAAFLLHAIHASMPAFCCSGVAFCICSKPDCDAL